MAIEHFPLILLFPLVGVLINALMGKRLPLRISGGIATLAIGLSFVWSLRALALLNSLPAAEDRRFIVPLWDWFWAGDFAVDFSLLLDPLSSLMILVVTGIGTLIHLYSIGYMSHDRDYPRFFAYLNLFTLAMLLLVLGSNYLVLFVGWEGVGLCSYLLIGFWYDKMFTSKMSNASAGKKAFIVNRIGDFGFLLALFLIFTNFHSLDFGTVFGGAGSSPGLRGADDGDRPVAPAGGDGQERAVAAVRLAPRRDGGPDAGQRPDPRGDHGDGGRLHGRPEPPDLRSSARGADDGRLGGGTDGALRRDDRRSPRTTSRRCSPTRPSVSSATCFSVWACAAFGPGHLPPDDARLLQGAALPRRGQRDPCLQRGAGHPQEWAACAASMPLTFATFLDRHPGHLPASRDSPASSARTRSWRPRSSSSPRSGRSAWLTAGLTSFYMFRLLFLTFFGASRVEPERAKKTARVARRDDPAACHPGPAQHRGRLGLGLPPVLGKNILAGFLEPVFAERCIICRDYGHADHAVPRGRVDA